MNAHLTSIWGIREEKTSGHQSLVALGNFFSHESGGIIHIGDKHSNYMQFKVNFIITIMIYLINKGTVNSFLLVNLQFVMYSYQINRKRK